MKRIPLLLIHSAVVTMVALAWSSLGFGGEIHDAAKAGDLAKVKTLLKDNPDLVFSKDSYGRTPLHLVASSPKTSELEIVIGGMHLVVGILV